MKKLTAAMSDTMARRLGIIASEYVQLHELYWNPFDRIKVLNTRLHEIGVKLVMDPSLRQKLDFITHKVGMLTHNEAGDEIDRGLILRRKLEERAIELYSIDDDIINLA